MTKNWRKVIRDRTIRVAEKRVNAMLKSLELLGNMGNTRNYRFEDGEVDKIIDTITNKMEEEFAILRGHKERRFFTLDDTPGEENVS